MAGQQSTEILNSWKEIATYLGRGVRTVQRWEHDLGLPVHRPRGKQRSAVVAIPDELDKWIQRTPAQALNNAISNHIELARNLRDQALEAANVRERERLKLQSKTLRQQAVAAREQLHGLVQQLKTSARSMHQLIEQAITAAKTPNRKPPTK